MLISQLNTLIKCMNPNQHQKRMGLPGPRSNSTYSLLMIYFHTVSTSLYNDQQYDCTIVTLLSLNISAISHSNCSSVKRYESYQSWKFSLVLFFHSLLHKPCPFSREQLNATLWISSMKDCPKVCLIIPIFKQFLHLSSLLKGTLLPFDIGRRTCSLTTHFNSLIDINSSKTVQSGVGGESRVIRTLFLERHIAIQYFKCFSN